MNIQSDTVSCLAGSRVLVAEDDPLMAMELQELLTISGAEIIGPVPTVSAAMAVLRSGLPDAAVLDVNLRNSSSAPIADALRAAEVPIVVLTAYGRDQLDDPVLLEGPVLSKPLRAAELTQVLSSTLRQGRPDG